MRRGCCGSAYSGSRLALVALLCSTFILAGSALTSTGTPQTAASTAKPQSPAAQGETKPLIEADYGRLPLYFIENRGQLDEQVKYYEKQGNHAIFFTAKEIRFAFYPGETQSPVAAGQHRRKERRVMRLRQELTPAAAPEVVTLTPVGMSPKAKITASEPTEGKVNYLCGPDPKKWRSNITTYRSVVYHNAYPGIDLKFYGVGRQLEYDIILQPGADPNRVKFRLSGIKDLTISEEGDLLVQLPNGGFLIQKKPLLYQEIKGARVKREGKFKLAGGEDKGVYSFEVASYDRTAPLVIDPVVLLYSTYLGGSGYDVGNAIAVDAAGNAYVTGTTFSPSFPTTSSAYQSSFVGTSDVFVTKIGPTGNLVYSTLLAGGQSQEGYGIAVDGQGCAYVTGYTDSSDFPTLNPWQPAMSGYSDGFVTKLSANGSSLSYSSFLGYAYDDAGYGIALDGNGNAYIAGETINQQSISKILVAKITAAGTLAYKFSFGGTNHDVANGIAVDNAGDVYITGFTQSTDFPVSSNSIQSYLGGASNAFLAKIAGATGNLIYGTYLGGVSSDQGNAIAVDNSGNAYITGTTRSYDFPLQNPLQSALQGDSDAFVAKIDVTGNVLVYSTFLGQANEDEGYAIALDGSGCAYITGLTITPPFPPPPASVQEAYVNNTAVIPADVFVVKIKDQGSRIVFFFLLGGNDDDWGNGIAVDQAGNIYVTGETWSVNFPTRNAYQSYLNGEADGFVTKMKYTQMAPLSALFMLLGD